MKLLDNKYYTYLSKCHLAFGQVNILFAGHEVCFAYSGTFLLRTWQ